MNARPARQRLIAEINITPFTDVILVLLVIFMITTPLIFQSSIRVNLPVAGSAKPAEGADEASIIVNDKGLIYLDGSFVTKQELQDTIGARYTNNSNLRVILFSDKYTRFKDIVSVLDVMNKIGVRNLNIAARTGR